MKRTNLARLTACLLILLTVALGFAAAQTTKAVPSPRKSSRPLESLQKTRHATSRNPRNEAAILAVPRLNLLWCAKRREWSL